MVNKFHGNGNSGGGMRNSVRKGSSTFTEKPGFPAASLPGKSQPSDRSAGVKKLKVHPKSEGL